MKGLLTANWFVALAGSLAYLATTFFCFRPAKFAGLRPVIDKEQMLLPLVESWNFKNPEFELMVEDLKKEREALATRELELRDLEARLANERHEIGVVTQAVLRLQRDLDQSLMRIKQDEIPNLKKNAKIHAAMSPDGSATILKEQTDEEVLKVLFYLKPAENGPILEALARLGKTEAQRAAQLTERLRRTLEPATAKPPGSS